MAFKTISVIGLGYIGLPTSALIASKSTHVLGVDINQKVVDTVNDGKIHIVEPDLDLIVSKAVPIRILCHFCIYICHFDSIYCYNGSLVCYFVFICLY